MSRKVLRPWVSYGSQFCAMYSSSVVEQSWASDPVLGVPQFLCLEDEIIGELHITKLQGGWNVCWGKVPRSAVCVSIENTTHKRVCVHVHIYTCHFASILWAWSLSHGLILQSRSQCFLSWYFFNHADSPRTWSSLGSSYVYISMRHINYEILVYQWLFWPCYSHLVDWFLGNSCLYGCGEKLLACSSQGELWAWCWLSPGMFPRDRSQGSYFRFKAIPDFVSCWIRPTSFCFSL